MPLPTEPTGAPPASRAPRHRRREPVQRPEPLPVCSALAAADAGGTPRTLGGSTDHARRPKPQHPGAARPPPVRRPPLAAVASPDERECESAGDDDDDDNGAGASALHSRGLPRYQRATQAGVTASAPQTPLSLTGSASPWLPAAASCESRAVADARRFFSSGLPAVTARSCVGGGAGSTCSSVRAHATLSARDVTEPQRIRRHTSSFAAAASAAIAARKPSAAIARMAGPDPRMRAQLALLRARVGDIAVRAQLERRIEQLESSVAINDDNDTGGVDTATAAACSASTLRPDALLTTAPSSPL